MSLEWVDSAIVYWAAAPVLFVYAIVSALMHKLAPAKKEPEIHGPREYSSYEEWRSAAVNPETPVDEVAARTPEGFFEKHPKASHAQQPAAAAFMKGLKEGEKLSSGIAVDILSDSHGYAIAGSRPYQGVLGPAAICGLQGPSRSAAADPPYTWREGTFTVTRIQPPDGIVGVHRGSFSDDDLTSRYGSGLYEVKFCKPGSMSPINTYQRHVTEAFGPPRNPNTKL